MARSELGPGWHQLTGEPCDSTHLVEAQRHTLRMELVRLCGRLRVHMPRGACLPPLEPDGCEGLELPVVEDEAGPTEEQQ